MHLAYAEALKAVGNSDPNPAVGAVVVSPAGEIVSTGYTRRAGYAHAERAALEAVASVDLGECSLYVTLEPCCHFGRTPPCTTAVLDRRIRRVVIGERDYAAEVKGESVALLQAAGLEVSVLPETLFGREKWFTTAPFFDMRKSGMPHVILKWAQTADGSLAPIQGSSGPISGEQAAFATAAMRSLFKLTVATPGVVQIDLPRLTVRLGDGNPSGFSASGLSPFFEELMLYQNSVNSELQLNAASETAKAPARAFMVAQDDDETSAKVKALQSSLAGTSKILPVNRHALKSNFAESLKATLRQLAADGYNSVLIEAGPQFSELLIAQGLVDAVAVYHSKIRSDAMLWSKPGRGNAMSRALAATVAMPHLEGFQLLEHASWPADEFFFFIKNA